MSTSSRTRVPPLPVCLSFGWFAALIVYGWLCAGGTIRPPVWAIPVPTVVSLILFIVALRSYRAAVRGHR
jgi:hypothetical protein